MQRSESLAAMPREISSRSAIVKCSRDRTGSRAPGRFNRFTARAIANREPLHAASSTEP
jgi:hypothetical protein